MEAPVSAITRHPNFLTNLPADVRTIIAGYLDGRQFARIGCCSYVLHEYVKKAEKIWKEFYLKENPYVNLWSISDWRERVARQGLIKRNIASENILDYDGMRIMYKDDQKQLFCHDLLFIASPNQVLCYNKQGKFLKSYPEISPDHPVSCVEMKKLDEDTLIIHGDRYLLIKKKDYEFQTLNYSGLFYYGDGKLVYRDNEPYKKTRLLNLADRSETVTAHFNQCTAYFGIHQNVLFASRGDLLFVADLESGEGKCFDLRLTPCAHHGKVLFSYPYIFFNYPSVKQIWCFSWSSGSFFILDDFGKMLSNGTDIILRTKFEIKKWDFAEKKFLFFAEVSRPEHLLMDDKRLIALWNSTVFIWDIKTAEIIKHIYVSQCRTSLISNNIIWCLNWNYYQIDCYDLSNGLILGSVDCEALKIVGIDKGSLLYIEKVDGFQRYVLMDLTRPLPAKKVISLRNFLSFIKKD